MPAKRFIIDQLVSGGLITNYYCTSRCRHCLYHSSPFWPKDYITDAEAEACFKTARRLGCRTMHIGGGEPLLRPERVAQVLRLARENGIHIEYVETNSSWYQSPEQACNILRELQRAGLHTLLVSISPFHLEHIPFYKVKGVVQACRQVGLEVFPWMDVFWAEFSRLDEKKKYSLEELEEIFGPGYVARIPQRYWLVYRGRALKTFAPYQVSKPLANVCLTGPCTELLDTTHFHLDLYGNYVPGLCAGLALRREDLGRELSPEKYPILNHLLAGGVKSFLEWATRHFGFKPRETYVSKCDLCHHIRSFLVCEKNLDTPELQPRYYYEEGQKASALQSSTL